MQQSVSGKVIVITGGSSGIGAAAAKILTQKGAQLIITGRSEETKKVAADIGCDYFLVDYSSFAEVHGFAEKLLAEYPRIDVLVNNVGGIIGEKNLFLISPRKGADTLIWLIEGEPGKDWKDGGYYYKRKPGRKMGRRTSRSRSNFGKFPKL